MNDPAQRGRRTFGEWLATKLAGKGDGDPTSDGSVREITGDTLELRADVTLVSFWAPWCGPCRMMRPLIDELAAEHHAIADDPAATTAATSTNANDATTHTRGQRLEVVRVNVDVSPAIAAGFGVMSVPTVVAVDAGGTERGRLTGLVPKRDLDAFVGALR